MASSENKIPSQIPNTIVNNLVLQVQNPFHLQTYDIGTQTVGRLELHQFVVVEIVTVVVVVVEAVEAEHQILMKSDLLFCK